MGKKLTYLKNRFFEKRFIILMIFSLSLSLVATAVTYLASWYIHETFDIPPVVKDLIWQKLPYFPLLWLAEVFMLLSLGYMLVWAFKRNKYYLPYAIFLFSSFHFFRAILIVLTPLGFPHGYNGFFHYGAKSVFMYGAFPSGHLSIPLLTFLITKSKIVLGLVFLTGLTMLISRSHYSIDLVGTVLVAYPLFEFSEFYLKKYFIK